MIVHNFNPVLVDLGILQIRWYSIAYILGIIIGWFYASIIIKFNSRNKHIFGQVQKTDFDDLITYLVLGIILGGRLGYVVFYNLEYYIQNFSEIFMLWKGGMSFHGGLLGVVFAIFIFSKNNSFFKYCDIVSCVAPIGLFFGRIANFINGELFGKASNLPWAVIFPNGGGIARHPSQIYEAILEGIVLFIIINFLALKKNLISKDGYIAGIFLVLYSVLRIFAENFREPDRHLGYFLNYFSMGSLLSFLTLIFGFAIIFFAKKNEQNN